MYALAGNYAHDVFLDTIDVAGILPGAILLIYIVKMIIRIVRIAVDKDENIYDRVLLIVFGCAVCMQFLVEPVLKSSPIFFSVVLFIDGVLSAYIAKKRYSHNLLRGNNDSCINK